MQFRADLHCHSTCSDGSETPLKLLDLAKQEGLSALSITDHDTIDAYTPELFARAEELGIQLLVGVEISSEKNQVPVHILGYKVDDSLKPFLQKIQVMRAERNRKILHKLASHRIVITEAELLASAPDRTVGRPHIAALMIKKGHVSSMKEAFDRYLRDGAPCYAAAFKYSPEEVIKAIHAAGGKAVLAHPHFIEKRSLVNELLTLPFDGIECYYARLFKEQETPWVKLAKQRGLIATGGSDYHGAIKPQIPLGASWVGEETFSLLAK